MALDALALLRLPASDLPANAVHRTLDDGVLVATRVSFASEPEELAQALRRVAGDSLERHRDPRGVLLMPDVARPQGKTYEAVVEEIGEGGTWISPDDDELEEGEGDLLASMMQAMNNPAMQDAIARARDAMMGAQPGAPADQERMIEIARSMSAGIESGPGGDTEAEMRAMIERHAGGAIPENAGDGPPVDVGALMSDPAFQRMVDGVRQQLLSDPSKMAELQALLAGAGEGDDEDER
ncbi:MAG: hypothetical protein M3Y87_20315 [Myxococcota bacterium]|nr:hypothetical protein [Myxococcota bacterium]